MGFVISTPRACLHSRHRDSQPDGFTPLTSHRWRQRSKNTQQPDPSVLISLFLPRKVWEQKHPSCPCKSHFIQLCISQLQTGEPINPEDLHAMSPSHHAADMSAPAPLRLWKNPLHTKDHGSICAIGVPSHQGLALALCGAGSV